MGRYLFAWSGLESAVIRCSSIGVEAFAQCQSLKSVDITNSVDTIRERAFRDSGLNSVTLPKSIKVVKSRAFDCPLYNLTINGAEIIEDAAFCGLKSASVVLPSNLKELGAGAFGDMIRIINVNSAMPPKAPSHLGYSDWENILIICPDNYATSNYRNDEVWGEFQVVTKGKHVVHMSGTGRPLSEEIVGQTRIMPGNITNLTITGKLSDKDWVLLNRNLVSCCDLDLSELDCTSVPDGAFKDMKRLLTVKLPSKAVRLGNEIFDGCSSLVSVKFGDKVTEIGDYAFRNCSYLYFVELPESLEGIGNGCFAKTNCIQTFTAPATLKYIGAQAFAECPTLRSVDLSASKVEIIGYETFWNCGHLREVILPESLWTIDDRAFYSTPINTIVFPERVQYIGSNAFSETGLLAVNLPSKILQIESAAFTNCKLMNSVSLGRSLSIIEEYAFAGNSKIMNISSFAANPPTVDSSVFDGISKRKCNVAIPTVNFWDYLNAPVWGGFSQLNNDLSVETDISEDADVSVAEETVAEELENIVGAEEDKAAEEAKSDNAASDAIADQNGIGQPEKARRRAAAPTRKKISVAGGFMKLKNGQKFTVSDSNKGYRFHIQPKDGFKITSVTLDGKELKNKISSDGYLTVDKIENIGMLVVKTAEGSSIEEVVAEGYAVTDDRIYDLTGRVVVNPGPGIYIKNGKKFLLK